MVVCSLLLGSSSVPLCLRGESGRLEHSGGPTWPLCEDALALLSGKNGHSEACSLRGRSVPRPLPPPKVVINSIDSVDGFEEARDSG